MFVPLFVLVWIGCSTAEELWSERSGGVLGGFANFCASEDPKNVSVSCHGVRIVRRVVQQFLDKSVALPSLKLSDGVQLVETSGSVASRIARNMKDFGVVNQVVNFLEGRELRIKLPSLLPDNLETALKDTLPSVGQGIRLRQESHGQKFEVKLFKELKENRILLQVAKTVEVGLEVAAQKEGKETEAGR